MIISANVTMITTATVTVKVTSEMIMIIKAVITIILMPTIA